MKNLLVERNHSWRLPKSLLRSFHITLWVAWQRRNMSRRTSGDVGISCLCPGRRSCHVVLVPWSGHIVEIQQPVVEIVSQFVHKKSLMVWFSTSVDAPNPSRTAWGTQPKLWFLEMTGLTIQQDIYQGCDVWYIDLPISIDVTTLVFQNALVKLLPLIDNFTAFDNMA